MLCLFAHRSAVVVLVEEVEVYRLEGALVLRGEVQVLPYHLVELLGAPGHV